MSEKKLWPSSIRKQDVGTSGGSKDYMLMGLLVVIIIAAVVLSIMLFTSKGNNIDEIDRWYKCTECDEEFSMKIGDIPQEAPRDLDGIYWPDCPKCGAEQSGAQMIRCPNPECKKLFVPNVEDGEDICPYCDVDRIKWNRERRKK